MAEPTQKLEVARLAVAGAEPPEPDAPPPRDLRTLAADEAVLGRLDRIDPFPAVVHRLLARTADPRVSLDEIERLLRADGALTAAVLRLSGASIFGRRPAPTLRGAIARVGLDGVRRLVVTASMGGRGDVLAAELWRYNLRCALLTTTLVQTLGIEVPADPFLCGLLHDVGVLAMVRLHGRDYARLHGLPGRDLLAEEELDRYGYTHGELGELLVGRWNLPIALQYVVRYHHDLLWTDGLPLQAPVRDLLGAVVLARLLTLDAPTPEERSVLEVARLRLGLRAPTVTAAVSRASGELAELTGLFAH